MLDTETTGLEVSQGHRIIEIGAVELVDRRLTGRHFHHYIDPERDIDEGAIAVHGISRAFLTGKPRFAEIAAAFVDFVTDAELVIHNAPFDVAFLDQELGRLPQAPRGLATICRVTDSLALARHKHPGQKNSLDALCRRYGVDNSARDLHGALLDAEILADVYLAMTGGQTQLFGSDDAGSGERAGGLGNLRPLPADRPRLRIITASAAEQGEHERLLDLVDKRARHGSIWRQGT